MATVEQDMPELVPGAVLTREEFLRRWELMPHVKRAELIRGVVYMPSPLSRDHGSHDNDIATWVGVYRAATPGCEATMTTRSMRSHISTPPALRSLTGQSFAKAPKEPMLTVQTIAAGAWFYNSAR